MQQRNRCYADPIFLLQIYRSSKTILQAGKKYTFADAMYNIIIAKKVKCNVNSLFQCIYG